MLENCLVLLLRNTPGRPRSLPTASSHIVRERCLCHNVAGSGWFPLNCKAYSQTIPARSSHKPLHLRLLSEVDRTVFLPICETSHNLEHARSFPPFFIDDPLAHSAALRSMFPHLQELGKELRWQLNCCTSPSSPLENK